MHIVSGNQRGGKTAQAMCAVLSMLMQGQPVLMLVRDQHTARRWRRLIDESLPDQLACGVEVRVM